MWSLEHQFFVTLVQKVKWSWCPTLPGEGKGKDHTCGLVFKMVWRVLKPWRVTQIVYQISKNLLCMRPHIYRSTILFQRDSKTPSHLYIILKFIKSTNSFSMINYKFIEKILTSFYLWVNINIGALKKIILVIN